MRRRNMTPVTQTQEIENGKFNQPPRRLHETVGIDGEDKAEQGEYRKCDGNPCKQGKQRSRPGEARREREVQEREDVGQELRPARVQLTPEEDAILKKQAGPSERGICFKCRTYVGRGIYRHSKFCTGTYE